MNRVYYIFILLISVILISCTSEGTSRLKRCKTVDLGTLTIYGGPPNAGEVHYENDSLAKVLGIDQYRTRLANRYLGLPFDREKKHIQKISFEFEDNRVTYVDENSTDAYPVEIKDENGNIVDKRIINQIVSTYEFENDSLFIYLNNGSRFFAAIGSSVNDTLILKRGFSFYPTTSGTEVKMDTTRTIDENIVVGYSKYNNMSELQNGDTIVFCNVEYKIY